MMFGAGLKGCFLGEVARKETRKILVCDWRSSARQGRELCLTDLGQCPSATQQRPNASPFSSKPILGLGITFKARGWVPLPCLGGLEVLRVRDWSRE